MKTSQFFRAAAICSLFAAGLAACTAEDSSLAVGDAFPECGDSNIELITMTARNFLPEDVDYSALEADNGSSATVGSAQTRTAVTINPDPATGGAIFQWSEGDMVGVFPNAGEQTGFKIKEGVGSNMAKFDGGSWALRPMADYAAYYPYRKSVEFGREAVPVVYPLVLTQNGNASTAHLAPTDFMAARAMTPQSGSVNFNFEHLGALVMLSVPVPTAGEVKQLVMEGSSPWYATAATADLTGEKPALKVTEWGSKLVMNLKGVTTAKADEKVTVLFMLAPTTLAAGQVKVTAGGFEGYLPAKTLEAGRVYRMEMRKKAPEYVDLGVSVLWATCNVGAKVPEEYGDYFAWGEIEPKSNYDEGNSLTCNKSGDWDNDKINGFAGHAQYDAATANWGALWRMPTKAEFQELKEKCSQTWVSGRGINGYLIRGRGDYSGNSIFLPATGYRDGMTFYLVGSYGNYWSAAPYESDLLHACRLDFNYSYFYTNLGERSRGFTVRPVREK